MSKNSKSPRGASARGLQYAAGGTRLPKSPGEALPKLPGRSSPSRPNTAPDADSGAPLGPNFDSRPNTAPDPSMGGSSQKYRRGKSAADAAGRMSKKQPSSQNYVSWEAPPTNPMQDLGQFLEEIANRRNCSQSAPSPSVERCSRCTKEEMWAVYDVFRTMDEARKHRISRKNFFNPDRLGGPSLMELRVLRKARLDERFRHSAEDITLEEFLQLVFPGCSRGDVQKMMHWARLKDAQAVLRDPKFRAEVPQLRQIFDILDENGDENLSMTELERAGILTKSEIAALLRGSNRDSVKFNCNFQEFLAVVQTHLKDTYVSTETRRAMEEEKQNDFQNAFRNALAG